jgi:hypothetical protein
MGSFWHLVGVCRTATFVSLKRSKRYRKSRHPIRSHSVPIKNSAAATAKVGNNLSWIRLLFLHVYCERAKTDSIIIIYTYTATLSWTWGSHSGGNEEFVFSICFMLIYCLAYSSALKKEMACSSYSQLAYTGLHSIILPRIRSVTVDGVWIGFWIDNLYTPLGITLYIQIRHTQTSVLSLLQPALAVSRQRLSHRNYNSLTDFSTSDITHRVFFSHPHSCN